MKTQPPELISIELNKAFIKQLDKNTILLQFKEGVKFELCDAIEANKTIYSISKGEPFVSLVDARVYGNISSDAREFFAKDILTKETRIAEAFVINNISTRLFVMFYLRINRPSNPAKIFADIEDAKIWLALQYKNKFGNIALGDIKHVNNFIEN